jgi:hypothetical protein
LARMPSARRGPQRRRRAARRAAGALSGSLPMDRARRTPTSVSDSRRAHYIVRQQSLFVVPFAPQLTQRVSCVHHTGSLALRVDDGNVDKVARLHHRQDIGPAIGIDAEGHGARCPTFGNGVPEGVRCGLLIGAFKLAWTFHTGDEERTGDPGRRPPARTCRSSSRQVRTRCPRRSFPAGTASHKPR